MNCAWQRHNFPAPARPAGRRGVPALGRFWLLAGLGLSVSAAPLKIELPAETEAFKPAAGAEIANGQCLTCHSVEYVTTQPPMPRPFWAASVKKMQEKYGATIPPEQVDPLLDYLVQNYGVGGSTNQSGPVTATATNAPAILKTPAPSAQSVAFKYGCLSCHHAEMKIVGPPYKEIAARYRGDPEATAKVVQQIQKGGSGKWGPVLMPPFPQVTPEETKLLAAWILGQSGK
jgi:sulfite dehydrogenase